MVIITAMQNKIRLGSVITRLFIPPLEGPAPLEIMNISTGNVI
jgi:hypothetical protein